MTLVLPGTTADRIEAWLREDKGYEGMTLGDLLSGHDLSNCVAALRVVERGMKVNVSSDFVECPTCMRRWKGEVYCDLPTCSLKEPEATEVERLRAALQFAIDGWDNQDINHETYRVKVFEAASDALKPHPRS